MTNAEALFGIQFLCLQNHLAEKKQMLFLTKDDYEEKHDSFLTDGWALLYFTVVYVSRCYRNLVDWMWDWCDRSLIFCLGENGVQTSIPFVLVIRQYKNVDVQ